MPIALKSVLLCQSKILDELVLPVLLKVVFEKLVLNILSMSSLDPAFAGY